MATLVDIKDFIFGVSAASLLCVYPLVLLVWIFLDSRKAFKNVEDQTKGGGGSCCRKRSKLCDDEHKHTCDKERRDQSESSKRTSTASAWQVCTSDAPSIIVKATCIAMRALRGFAAFMLPLRLLGYATLLCPWFLQIAHAYVTHPLLRRGIRYGPNARNYLDLYLSDEALAVAQGKSKQKVPVVVIAMGGAWVIGHRVWNTHLALRLSSAGVIVVAVDYRNFPFAQVPDMVEDLEHALDWIFANVSSYGGDVGNIALMGQSAGAHLEALLIVDRAMVEARSALGGRSNTSAMEDAKANASSSLAPRLAEPCRRTVGEGLCSARGAWSVRDIKAWVGVSGVYDLVTQEAHMKAIGVPSWLHKMCPGGDLARHSATRLLVEAPEWQSASPYAADAAARLPPTYLFHGENDTSVPVASIVDFASALRSRGAKHTRAEVRPGLAHSTPVVEDPLRGGDLQPKLIMPFLGPEAERRLSELPPPWPQPPRIIVDVAEYLMPF